MHALDELEMQLPIFDWLRPCFAKALKRYFTKKSAPRTLVGQGIGTRYVPVLRPCRPGKSSGNKKANFVSTL